MSTRLLSFLSDIERSIAADDPEPAGGTWENLRTVSFHQGLARMSLVARTSVGPVARGAIFLQCFRLADGSICIKAALNWADAEFTGHHTVFDKPGVQWTSEARRIAAEWLAGPPAGTVVTRGVEDMAALATG